MCPEAGKAGSDSNPSLCLSTGLFTSEISVSDCSVSLALFEEACTELAGLTSFLSTDFLHSSDFCLWLDVDSSGHLVGVLEVAPDLFYIPMLHIHLARPRHPEVVSLYMPETILCQEIFQCSCEILCFGILE